MPGMFGIDPGWLSPVVKGIAQGVPKANFYDQNKLLFQLLMGAGMDLLQNTPGKNLGAAFGQNMTSGGFLGILKKMLSGDFSGGEMKVGPDGMKINIPTPQQEAAAAYPTAGAAFGISPTSDMSRNTTGSNNLFDTFGMMYKDLIGSRNPFGSSLSGISAADLVGVPPELLTQALTFKLQGEQLDQQKFSNFIDAAYKQGLLNYYQEQLALGKAGNEVDKINAATKLIEAMTKDERTEFIKNYEYAVSLGYKGTASQWKVLSDNPTSVQEYLFAQTPAGGNYKGTYPEFLLKYKKSETNISISPYEQTRQRNLAQREADVMDSNFTQKVQEAEAEASDWDFPSEVEDQLKEAKDPEQEAVIIQRAQMIRVLKTMDSRIRQAFATKGTVERRKDGWYLNGELLVRNPYARE